jgi:hypothetical protein
MIKEMLVDNYKGFCNESFEFNKCNFLVGENSTGKTAIIDLIRNVYIVNELDFTETDWQNTPFRQLISQDIDHKKAVITVCFSTISDSGFVSRKYYQIKNKDDYPFVARLSLEVKANLFVHIKHENKQFRYNLEQYDNDMHALQDFRDYCENVSFKKTVRRVVDRRNIFPWEIVEHILSKINNDKSDSIQNQIDLFNNVFVSGFRYTGPLRHIPEVYEMLIKRDYDISGKDLLYRYMQIIKENKEAKDKINSFGIRSGLYELFSYETFSTPMPIVASTTTVSKNNVVLPLKFHGTGLSQVMPIILDLYTQDDILVSQPELHLHPRAQFELGKELFNTLFSTSNRQYFIETHSDFIIDAAREEQFLMKKVYEYLQANKNISNSTDNETPKLVNFRGVIKQIKKFLSEKCNVESHKSIDETISRCISLYNSGVSLKSYISLNFFTTLQERVYNIQVELDGSLTGEHISKYRDFYMDYAFRGLNL